MTVEIKVPTLGESVIEATVGRWLKQTGDAFSADELLVELETDKVSVEVPAPVAGVLTQILAQEGDAVEIGAALGMIEEGANSSPEAAVAVAVNPTARTAGNKVAIENVQPSMPPSPSAGKLLREKRLSPDQLSGSGRRGQILKEDVQNLQATGSSASSNRNDIELEERVRMSRLRQTIARRLKEAQNTAAMLTTFNEVDMGTVMELRKKYKALFEEKHGVKLGFMGFFTKAVCQALKEIPAINAEIDGTDLVYKKYCHIGVAVGTPKGLVVPVMRHAQQMSIAEMEKSIGNLGRKAREGQLTMDDMQGGTFTISNGGVYGSLMSTPILNAPQSGILGMHKIQERPVAIDGQVIVRPMMYLALSYDHRIVDGNEAVTFLVRVKENLEDPERLVLDL